MGGRYGESYMETYITIYKIASGNLLYDSGELKLGLGNSLEGWNEGEVGGRFKWEGTWVDLWLIHNQCNKAIILQLKINR